MIEELGWLTRSSLEAHQGTCRVAGLQGYSHGHCADKAQCVHRSRDDWLDHLVPLRTNYLRKLEDNYHARFKATRGPNHSVEWRKSRNPPL